MSQPPALQVQHHLRVSILEKDTTWTLHGHDLVIEPDDTAACMVPLAWVTRLSLRYDPSRAKTRRFRCRPQLLDDRTLVIQNEHDCGFASFEDRSGFLS